MSSNENDTNNESNSLYSQKKEIKIFSSFEDQKLFYLTKMANQNHRECLEKLDELRRIFYKDYLLPDGSWPPIKKTIKFKTPFI